MSAQEKVRSADSGAGKGRLSRLFHRLTADPATLDAEELETESVKVGASCCRDISQGESVKVAGRLRSVVYTPNERVPTLEAELFDGTGSLKLVWLGQRRIAGIEPGRQVVVAGRIADRSGERALYNPWYELVPTN